jgi:predicted nucleic acid-binding protein
MKAVLDTRFFVAIFEKGEEQFQRWAKLTLDGFRSENVGIVPSIVILELYKVELERLGKEVADLRVNAVLKSTLKTIDLNSSIAIEAAKLRCKYAELPTADAIIAATAIKSASDYVLTDDKHIKQIKETKTRWAGNP